MIFVVDNYDSFTYNLVQLIGSMELSFTVRRNDSFSLEEVEALNPSHIIVSPGPGRPENTGRVLDLLREYVPRLPVLGVCLGHQALAYFFGGRVVKADRLMHGKTSRLMHEGAPLFQGLPQEFTAARYHSLMVSREGLPSCLDVTCRDEEGEVMGIEHREYPAAGVQFHPESIATPGGDRILANFIKYYSLSLPREGENA